MYDFLNFIIKHVNLCSLLMSILSGLAVFWATRKPAYGFLSGYSVLILFSTIIDREPKENIVPRFALLISYGNSEEHVQIAANIVMFVPIGIAVFFIWKYFGILYGFLLSLFVETTQLVTGRGMFEADDLFHNTIGTIAGCLAAAAVLNRKQRNGGP